MQLFNDLQLRKSIAAEKMAEATFIQAEAERDRAVAEKERAGAEMREDK